jgi:hypothetical protein
LGLALGKSISEIRALPYPEFRRWQLLYMLEPWGWEDREYRTAAILAQIHNANITKRNQAKTAAFFMRDMEAGILRQLKENSVPDLSDMEPEARKEFELKAMREFFGV